MRRRPTYSPSLLPIVNQHVRAGPPAGIFAFSGPGANGIELALNGIELASNRIELAINWRVAGFNRHVTGRRFRR